MHFKEKSLAKRLYFLLTNGIYESFIVSISYMFLFLCLLEPGNHSERPYEVTDASF